MTQYNNAIVKSFNCQLDKLKSAIKNETVVTLRLSSNYQIIIKLVEYWWM